MKLVLAPLLASLVAVTLVARAEDASSPVDDDAQLRQDAFAAHRTRDRRKRLLEKAGPGAVFVLVQRPTDSEELDEWQPSKDLLYLSGCREPKTALVLAGDTHVLFALPRDVRAEVWRGARLYAGEPGAAERLQVDRVAPFSELKGYVQGLVEDARAVYLSGIKAQDLDLPARLKPRDAGPPIGLLRQVKDEAELKLLQRAISASVAGHIEMMKSAAPGRYEFELQAAAEYVFHRYGAERQGYASIVGSGPNSCILHYAANRRKAKDGDVVCADLGAEVGGYTADVTRTFPVNGKFTPEQRRIYDIVLEAQAAGIRAVKPGATIRQVHAAALAVIQKAGHAAHFPHGTSHWLGMDVHDVGDYARPFEPGMVLTVEPGIYLTDKEIGVRIEDDVVVTPDGCKNLSASCPREADEIEALVRQSKGVGARPVAPLPPFEPIGPFRKGRLY